MQATNQKLACAPCRTIDKADAESDGEAQRNGTSTYLSTVIESSGDEPWAEFCKALVRPAFLLPDSGFGDLE
jgi:hypothetical protein